MKRPVTSTEIETVIKNLPTNESPAADNLTDKFCQTFREELTLILLKVFQKIVEEGTLPSSFYRVTIMLITKPNTDAIKKRILQVNVTDEHNIKILNKTRANQI